MRAKDKVRLNVLRGIVSAIQYEEIRKGKDALPDEEIVAVLKSELKKRDEAMEYAKKDGRVELQEELERERAVLMEFLPQQLSEAELEQMIQTMKAAEPGINLGAVMKRLRDEHAGRFDGKVASAVAKRLVG